MIVDNLITSKAALIIDIPTGNGKQLRPELPTNVAALEIAMIPIRNEVPNDLGSLRKHPHRQTLRMPC
jgi:hypothetical protein